MDNSSSGAVCDEHRKWLHQNLPACRERRAGIRKEGQQEMPLSIVLTATERERLAIVVNNLCFYASQILQGSPVLSQRALANLAKTKNEQEALLKRLDEVAREQGDESLLRVIEDLARLPTDVSQMMTLVRRCLLAAAFLGHCLAQPTHSSVPAETQGSEKRLH
jgi:hypothetical protein